MVIQANMSPKVIVEVWEVTEDIFNKHKIPLTRQTIETLVEEEQVNSLLEKLNAAVGCSSETCIKGG